MSGEIPPNPGEFMNNTERAVWQFIIDCNGIYKHRRYRDYLSKAKELYNIAMSSSFSQFLSLYWRYVLGICGDTNYLQGLNDDVAEAIKDHSNNIHNRPFSNLKEKLEFVIDKLLTDLCHE